MGAGEKIIKTDSEKDSIEFGINLSKNAKTGVTILLSGELGAGKTIISKGIAQGLGIKQTIQSPTFIIYRLYPVKNNKNIKQLCHVDAYRLDENTDLNDIGIQEFIDDPKTLTIIEWPENIEKLLKKYKDSLTKIQINIKGMEKREIVIS